VSDVRAHTRSRTLQRMRGLDESFAQWESGWIGQVTVDSNSVYVCNTIAKISNAAVIVL